MHLGGHVDEGGEGEGPGGGEEEGGVLGQVGGQEGGQVPVLQVFHHHKVRPRPRGAKAKHPGYMGILETK